MIRLIYSDIYGNIIKTSFDICDNCQTQKMVELYNINDKSIKYLCKECALVEAI